LLFDWLFVLVNPLFSVRAFPVLTSLVAAGLALAGVWSAWDDGGGYRRTPLATSCVLLSLLPFGWALAWRLGWRRAAPSGLVGLACLVWTLAWLQTVPLLPARAPTAASQSQAAPADTVNPSVAEWQSLPAALVQEVNGSDAAVLSAIQTDRRAISVAPTFTRLAMAGPAAFGIACWLASLCLWRRQAGIWFLGITAIAGAMFAFLGLADAIRLDRDHEVELRQRLIISPVGADDPFGPFVNNNSGAGYLNLTLGCAIGLLAIAVRHRPVGGERSGRTGSPLSDPLAMLSQWRIVGAVLLIVLMAAGILGSSSRGGFLGLAAGSLTLAVVSFSRLAGYRVRTKIAVVAMTLGVLWLAMFLLDGLGMKERSIDRLMTLYRGEALEDPRLDHWRDGLVAAKQYFPAGSGLGTYRFAYLPYQQFSAGGWFVNADGMHVEWLVEGGVWLLPIVIVGIVWLVREMRQLAHRLRRPVDASAGDPPDSQPAVPAADAVYGRALVTAMTFMLPALLVTQSFDFGILQPPLYLTFAAICGAITGSRSHLQALATQGRQHVAPEPAKDRETPGQGSLPKGGSAKWARRLPHAIGGLTLIGLTVGLVGAAGDLRDGTLIEQAARRHARNARRPADQLPDFATEIAALDRILARQPHHSDAHHVQSQLLIAQQRRLGARYLVDEGLVSSEQVNRWVSPRTVRRAYHVGQEAVPNDQGTPKLAIEDLLLPPQDHQVWQKARQHAIAALAGCPLNDVTHVLLIEMDMLTPTAKRATPELLQRAATLRSRNEAFQQHLRNLSNVYPGAEIGGSG